MPPIFVREIAVGQFRIKIEKRIVIYVFYKNIYDKPEFINK